MIGICPCHRWLVAMAFLVLIVISHSSYAAEDTGSGLSCPHWLPYSVDKSSVKDWVIEGSNTLSLDEITIWSDAGEGISLDPIDIKKAWAGPPINTEIETSTYAIKGNKSIGCYYGEGVTGLDKDIPVTIRSCQIIRKSSHEPADDQLRIVCR